MADTLIQFRSEDAGVQGLICLTTGLTNEACQRHGTSATASAALARVLTAGALMGGTLKGRHASRSKVSCP